MLVRPQKHTRFCSHLTTFMKENIQMTWGISKEGGTQCKYVKKAKQNKKKLLAFHAVNFKAREPIILIELQYGIVILILNTVNSIAWFS